MTYIVSGVRAGFRIGFQYKSVECKAATRNMPAASLCEGKIDEFLATECAAGRTLGPFERELVPMVYVSRLGAVPKSTLEKYRLIVDLSHPENQSVNDGISESRCSLSYVSVEEVARTVLELGRGTRMAKVDIRNAYRNVPVHPDDRWLLGMSWRGSIFIDAVLPFGLRSAPKIFNSVADALEWIVGNAGVKKVFHYLDDFQVLGAPGSEECAHGLTTLLGLTEWLGFPVATEKVEEPTTRLTFISIEIDSESLTLRFPEEKLLALKTLLSSWKDRRWCRKTELQSLAGKLQHACKVVRPGRSFVRRVFEQLKGTRHNHHHIR